jgi:DNA repair exonuclease SbcCD nuclease subunit
MLGNRIVLLLCIHAATVAEAVTASHRFSPLEAEVIWAPSDKNSFLEKNAQVEDRPVRIMHLTDNHISIDDFDPPRTSRMYNAFVQTSDHFTERATSPKDEFVQLLRKARKEKVDLIALGGDLVNYPSPKTVNWILEQLHTEARDIPFVYTAGNHDWHEEGIASDRRYDAARRSQLNATLRPLFDQSASSLLQAGPNAGRLYGKTSIRGVDVVFVDNSNYQVDEEQQSFLEKS